MHKPTGEYANATPYLGFLVGLHWKSAAAQGHECHKAAAQQLITKRSDPSPAACVRRHAGESPPMPHAPLRA
eukprot:254589-Amphidinium_carterae.1